MKISDVIGSKVRHVLSDAFDEWEAMLCNGRRSTLFLLSLIKRNTIGRNQFEWSIKFNQFFSDPENPYSQLFSVKQLYKAVKSLEDKKLIQRYSHHDRMYIRLNLPGILYTVSDLWGDAENPKFEWKKHIAHLQKEMHDYWIDSGWKLDFGIAEKQEHLMNIKESVDKARQQSKEAQKRQREKRKAKNDKSANAVRDYMKTAYEEHYPDTKYRETWISKKRGQAVNWLKELETLDPPPDPAEVIDRVVKNWYDIRRKIRDDYGNRIEIDEYPTFATFYRYRDQIDIALRKIGEKSNVVYLSDEVKFRKVEV